MQKVFISYSRRDIDFAKKLASDLEQAGYDVWWDITDLRGGDDWVRTLPAAIEAAQHFIIVLTPNSVESEWVRREYTQALNLRKKVMPIMLELCPVPFALNTINFINFMSGEYADNFENLLSALGYTGEPPVVEPLKKSKLNLPPALRKYAVPIIVGALLLFAFAWVFFPKPASPPTAEPSATMDSPSFTPTAIDPAVTSTPTPTETATPLQESLTPSPTIEPFIKLTYCINSLYAFTINVRSGPGTNYGVQGEPLEVGKCLAFRGTNLETTWLLIAPDQADPAFRQYEGGWIHRELLGLRLVGPIDLPAVTLTPTPMPSQTPTITPTFTPSPTDTATDIPEPTETPAP